ncbi:MAG: DNA internalization-related competence protein ComEC/Rec2, partial [Gammaproteobacteria bacterium]|nr:DNA internalization-related competence protein ComEC/Rec2 [Gammaproteobacteria bacterium]
MAQDAPGRSAARWLATPYLLAFAAGVVVPQRLAELPSAGTLVALLFVAGLTWRRCRWPLAFVVGLAWSTVHAQARLNEALPEVWVGRDVEVSGTIATLPRRRGRATRFEFLVAPGGSRDIVPRRVRVAWYGAHPPLHAGDRWHLRLRLKPPRGFRNPGGFDYEGWLFRRGIRATGYVRAHPENRRLGPAPGPGAALQRLRQRLAGAFDGHLDGSPRRGLVKALALGDREGIGEAQWKVLRETGTSHLVAISGLHLGLVAGLVFAAVRRVWAWVGLAGWWPAPWAAAWLTLPAVALYAGLAGFTVPTRRALLMVAIVLTALLLRRGLGPGRALALALAGVLLLDPMAPGEAGFWLSFGAVALILYTVAWRRPGGWRFARVAWLQVVLGLGLAPLLVAAFQQVPLAGPLANLVAVPAVGIGVVPLVLLGTLLVLPLPGLGAPLLELADRVLAVVWSWLEACAALPYAGWNLAAPPLVVVGFCALGTLLLLLPRGVPLRFPGLILMLPLLGFRPAAPEHGAAWLTLLDVGQGLAAVVRTETRALV